MATEFLRQVAAQGAGLAAQRCVCATAVFISQLNREAHAGMFHDYSGPFNLCHYTSCSTIVGLQAMTALERSLRTRVCLSRLTSMCGHSAGAHLPALPSAVWRTIS